MGLISDVYTQSDFTQTYQTVTEEQIHGDETVRKKLIKSFDTDRNKHRKREAFKAYECLKDKTVNYVVELLVRQFDHTTVLEMHYALANVSILRKVIDKLAKVYANGVKRTMPDESAAAPGKSAKPAPKKPKAKTPAVDPRTAAIEDMVDFLDFNAVMKKANRFFRTFKNTLVYVRPLPIDDKFTLELEVRAPFSYDVIPEPKNPKEPLAIILSDYVADRQSLYALGDAAAAGRTVGIVRDVKPPELTGLTQDGGSEDTREYIWWTANYHFTTDANGKIKPQDDPSETADLSGDENPIAELPFVNFAGEQDHGFWSEGGEDLVDAGIKINTMISNLRHIAVAQGYGQMYMTGKNLPKSMKVGPNHCIQLTQEEGEPEPKVGFMNAAPQLAELQALVEMDVALMLSTNNLSTSSFSSQLTGSNRDLSSGVALLIDRSESVEDIEEQTKIFIKKEPLVWAKVAAWYEVYKSKDLLVEELSAIELPPDVDTVQLQFPSAKPIISETDQLNIFLLREQLGLNTKLDLIMRDDPSLTEEEAQEKLDKIDAEKQTNAAKFGLPAQPGQGAPGSMPGKPGMDNSGGGMSGNQGQASGGKPGQNGNQPGNNQGPKGKPSAQNPNKQ